jgi:hypothetical protein
MADVPASSAFFALGTPLFDSPERFAAQSAELIQQGVERLRKHGAGDSDHPSSRMR